MEPLSQPCSFLDTIAAISGDYAAALDCTSATLAELLRTLQRPELHHGPLLLAWAVDTTNQALEPLALHLAFSGVDNAEPALLLSAPDPPSGLVFLCLRSTRMAALLCAQASLDGFTYHLRWSFDPAVVSAAFVRLLDQAASVGHPQAARLRAAAAQLGPTQLDPAACAALTGLLLTAQEAVRKEVQRCRRHATLVSGLTSDYIYTFLVAPDDTLTLEQLSAGFEHITGYTYAEVTSLDSPTSLIHPADLALAKERYQRLLSGLASNCELRLLTRGGTLRWVRDYAIAEWDESEDRVVRIVGAGIDITDQKQSDLALRASEARYRQIVETASEGVWVLDDQWQTTFVNARMAVMLGYQPDEMLGRVLFDFMDTEAQHAAREHIAQRENGFNATHDFRLRHRDGSDRWVMISATPLLDDAGRFNGALGMVTDVTERRRVEEEVRQLNESLEHRVAVRTAALHREIAERRQAEERLRESQRFNERITTASPNTIYVFDLRTQANVYANRNIALLLGYSINEVQNLGTTVLSTLIHPDDLPGALAHQLVLQKAQDGDVHTLEYRMRHIDGNWRWIMSYETVFDRDSDGTPIQLLGIAVDITAQKQIELELRMANEQAEAALRTQAAFLAMMSHEIRTPMNGIIGMSGLLLDTPLSAEQREYAETVHRSGEGLLSILNDILDFSKIQAGRLDLEELDFAVRQVVEDVTELFAKQAEHKGLQLSCLIDPAVPWSLRGDPGRLRQVLTNLVANAIKFTLYGEVRIRVVLLTQQADHTTIELRVEDTGIGIPPEVLPRLFQPFTQADRTTTRLYGGTGLGLAICRQLVTLMGGTITVTDRPGGGTVLSVTLSLRPALPLPSVPLYDLSGLPVLTVTPPRAAASASEPMSSQQPQSGGRILVVEDNPTNQRVTVRMLEKLGYQAEVVVNGQAALDALEQHSYSLVLMDCHMPVMDGITATMAFRAREHTTQHLPIIALTAEALSGERERCLAAGMDDYLSKPVSQAQLRDTIQRWLERPPLGAPPAPLAATPSGALTLDRTALEHVLGAPINAVTELTRELIDVFINDTPTILHTLEQALTEARLTEVQIGAHTLKGAASYLGLIALRERCVALEHLAACGSPHNLQPAHDALGAAYREAVLALKQLRAEVS